MDKLKGMAEKAMHSGGNTSTGTTDTTQGSSGQEDYGDKGMLPAPIYSVPNPLHSFTFHSNTRLTSTPRRRRRREEVRREHEPRAEREIHRHGP
jgi:hypothetical protein